MNWVLIGENLTLLHVNNKGTDQPAHLLLESTMAKLATSKVLIFYLVFVPKQAGNSQSKYRLRGDNLLHIFIILLIYTIIGQMHTLVSYVTVTLFILYCGKSENIEL